MFDLDSLREIGQTIARNRKRSVMTAFGVFWGIFMLAVLSGAGLGLKRAFLAEFGEMEVNSGFYQSDLTSVPYGGMQAGRGWTFEDSDTEAVRNNIEGIANVTGIVNGRSCTFVHGSRKGTYSVSGYSPDIQRISPHRLAYGRSVNSIDVQRARKVCILGEKAWKELFPEGENPVGTMIRMNNIYMTVVGVFMPGGGGVYGNESSVAVPATTLQRILNRGNRFDMQVVAVRDRLSMADMEKKLKALIRQRHRISPDDTKAIYGFNTQEYYNKISGLLGGVSLLVWIVGTGTLLAGIVGISNIMLVIVRERTQEIGIRRALGARPRAIISQILAESFVLTFVAGIAGLALAVGILSLAEQVFSAAGQIVHPQITFGMAMIFGAILTAGGGLAGVIPAGRAIRIKPVDAIREE